MPMPMPTIPWQRAAKVEIVAMRRADGRVVVWARPIFRSLGFVATFGVTFGRRSILRLGQGPSLVLRFWSRLLT